MSLLLASASLRRAALLSQLGVEFRQASVDIDETPFENEAAVDYVVRMAHEKAQAALGLYSDSKDRVILAADTSVVLGKRIFGKPTGFNDFTDMMQILSGQHHQVFTAVTVIKKVLGREAKSSVKTVVNTRVKSLINENSVQFGVLNDEDISWYWQTGEPRNKAGGYGIQGQGARFVRSINGSYSGIVGLPLYETAEILGNFGILAVDSYKQPPGKQ